MNIWCVSYKDDAFKRRSLTIFNVPYLKAPPTNGIRVWFDKWIDLLVSKVNDGRVVSKKRFIEECQWHQDGE